MGRCSRTFQILLVIKENIDIFNKTTFTWIVSELEIFFEDSRVTSGVVYLDDELYIVGGGWTRNTLTKLDKNMKCKRLADMFERRRGITNSCLEWNGSIVVIAGLGLKRSLRSVERYDPLNDKWSVMP